MLITMLNLQQYLPGFVHEPAFYVGLAAWWLHRAVTRSSQQTQRLLTELQEAAAENTTELRVLQQRVEALEALFIEEYGRVA